MAGYELMVAGEVIRGRFRKTTEKPEAMMIIGLFPGRKVEGYGFMVEMPFMGTVTERFVLGKTATTDRNHFPACQSVNTSALVDDLEIAFYLNRSVTIYCKLCGCHLELYKAPKIGKSGMSTRFIFYFPSSTSRIFFKRETGPCASCNNSQIMIPLVSCLARAVFFRIVAMPL
jgi:hypothetical protein